MLDDLYTERLRALAADVPRLGRLSAPDASVTAYSRLCGSTISVDIVMRDSTITDFALQVKACVLAKAASAILAEHIVGSTADELCGLRRTVWSMLKENGPPPSGKWKDIAIFVPVRDLRMRHSSTLLVFDAVVEAIEEITKRPTRGSQ